MMEEMIFDTRQPRALNGGRRVLLLLNERRVEVAPVAVTDDVVETPPAQWAYDGVWLETDGETDEAALLRAARRKVDDAIVAYDQGERVNGFFLGGRLCWLDKETRVGLVNSTTIAKGMGMAETTLWLNGERLTFGCDAALQMLGRLEMYALECFNVTAAHRKAVAGMADVSEVLRYDFSQGYPERLVFDV